jgi:hypothetical protein
MRGTNDSAVTLWPKRKTKGKTGNGGGVEAQLHYAEGKRGPIKNRTKAMECPHLEGAKVSKEEKKTSLGRGKRANMNQIWVVYYILSFS